VRKRTSVADPAAERSSASPRLDAAVKLFEAGDYDGARKLARGLAEENGTTPGDRRAALELIRRLSPDPLSVRLLGVAGALLAFLALWFLLTTGRP
jgi:hypothetical protein